MIRAALSTAFIVLSSAAWAQCADVRGMVCAPGASASLRGDATVYRGKAIERVSGVSVLASGQRVVVADKPGSLAIGDTCRVNVPAFSTVTLSSKDGTLCARGVRSFSLNGKITNTAGFGELNRFVGQAGQCPDGTRYNAQTQQCVGNPNQGDPPGNGDGGGGGGGGGGAFPTPFVVGAGIVTAIGAGGNAFAKGRDKNPPLSP